MSPADDTRTRSGEALTLTWPHQEIALVTMIREREMNTLSLELLGELDEALTASVDGAISPKATPGSVPAVLRYAIAICSRSPRSSIASRPCRSR
jgi:hypothetical protein